MVGFPLFGRELLLLWEEDAGYLTKVLCALLRTEGGHGFLGTVSAQ
jgi:hypothetical protein